VHGTVPSAQALRGRVARHYVHEVLRGGRGARDWPDQNQPVPAADAERTRRALTLLAVRMSADRVRGLGWWDVPLALPRPVQVLPWLIGGLCVGVSLGALTGVPVGIVLGLFAGVVFVREHRRASARPHTRVPRHTVLRGPRRSPGRAVSLASRSVVAPARAAGRGDDPRWSLRLCRAYALYAAPPATVLVLALWEGYMSLVLHAAPSSLGAALGGAVGVAVALVLASPWGQFVVARHWLAWRHGLPRDILEFLDDACERGILLQVGAVWEFRHPAVAAVLASEDGGDRRERAR
jgi:hypothetical protein